jgi:hypothetical protein
MQNTCTPEVTLSKEGYLDLQQKVMVFQTELQLATSNTLGFILQHFQDFMKPYYWLQVYDVIGLMATVDKMFICDATRKELSAECDKLIEALSEAIKVSEE